LKLEQVAAQTKIRQHLLQAIEENRFDRLPGGLFTRSFLRQYTHALELNEDEILASLQQQFEPPPVALPEPPRRSRTAHLSNLPSLVWLIGAMIGCSGLYGLWHKVTRSQPYTSAARTRGATDQAGDILNPGPSPLPSGKTRQPEPQVIEDPTPVLSAGGEPRLALGFAAMRVVFATSEPVWLSIKSDGVNSFSGTLGELQSREFDASAKMTVLVGNAGGLTISLNGKPVQLRGAHGEIQSLVLTPTGAHVVPRTPPAPLVMPSERDAPPGEREEPVR
jgi:hypothetical protein